MSQASNTPSALLTELRDSLDYTRTRDALVAALPRLIAAVDALEEHAESQPCPLCADRLTRLAAALRESM